ncbi:RIMS-binding protein 2 isoform X3 [Kryptolebias marmoratus]|uniref:RIMS-binding protein 2 isoform X3 n=1 Tax=Kryptolebias marmoratus TaxID=37003 RepID=UPI0018ACD16F|nr:RIMS-binding protein 2 isoform X3 [Kryptolebias marmoratus]
MCTHGRVASASAVCDVTGKEESHAGTIGGNDFESKYDISSQQAAGHSTAYNVNRFRLLEEKNRALKHEVVTLRQEKQHYRKLKAKLHAALQEKNRLNLELVDHHLKASKYDQVQCDYEQLRQTFAVVSRERDVAQQQRKHLQLKVDNLEQLLKHMHEALELKQQLQTEHEQALVALHNKQREINQLQKAWLRTDQQHEEAVHLLEVKLCDLEQKCRSHSEHFHQLSKELLSFRLHSEPVEILIQNRSTPASRILSSPEEKLSEVTVEFGVQSKTGDESAANTPPLISQFLPCPTQTGDGEPSESLSVEPSTVTTDRSSSPRKPPPSEMEDETSPSPRSKPRYTGQVRLCTARYSYNPYDGPNEHPEAELPLVAGKYLYVYGDMDDDGFYEGELLDGQRGLVPSNFVEFVQDKEKPIGEGGELPLDHTPLALMTVDGGASQDGFLGSSGALVPCSNGTGGPLDPEDLAEDVVPYPRKITQIKQLARSVIVAWEPPVVPLGWGNISGYNVLVDGELRASMPYGGRTKCLLEKLDLDGCIYRVSVQSVTDRGLSDELRCTLLVGANVVVAPCGLRVDDIQRDTAELSWLPSNSNYSHTVYLDGAEHAVVKPGRYRLRFLNLKPLTVYKVTVAAQPHQVPWQLPLEQRERKEAGVEFCTQAAGPTPFCRTGPPLPPHDVQVLCGQAPGVLQVRWKPPVLSPTGTSNGANVIGYAVCTKGQRIAEVLVPMADYVTIDLTRIQCLEAREVIVRTLSVQGESQDSQVAVIPNNLLVPLPSIPLPAPMHPHAGPPPHPLPHPQPHLQSPHPTPQLPAPPHPQPLPPHPQHPQAHPRLPHPGRLPHPHPQPQPLHLQPCPPHQGPRPQHRLPLLPHPQPHPIPQRPVSARDLDAKEHAAHHGRALPPGHQHGWDPARSTSQPPVPMPGHTLEPPPPTNLRSPSPQRILPQPQGTLIPDTVAKAIAREAAQRVAAESGKGDRRQGRYGEQGHSFHQHPSDEEEEDEEGFAHGRRRGPSVDEFLRGSELGRPPHYSHNEEYHSESSRGSDLSDIMEEDEEELYSEMQLEEGGRRRNSHNTPKSNSPAGGRHDRDGGRRTHSHLKRRPLMVPSIEVTSENNSEGNLSSVTEEVNYGRVARHRKWSSRRHMGGTRSPHDGYRNRDRRSPTYYDESEPEEHFRIFVALFDYDPLSMSPNPDAADEELPFKEGQIIKIYGDKDTDGFYRGEVKGRMGLIPCNMVSEIRADDEETMDHLIKQGFLPLSTPVDKIEQNRRGLRRDQASRRMVALYDYDPRESSPNVDVEAELTFCAGDIIAVFGDIDEDGFYYGELNGHRGLVPSNFLEEVPDDVEVYLTDTPSHYPQEEPANRPPANSAAAISEGKRVTAETTGTANNISTPVRAPSPIVRPLLPGTMRPLSPPRGPHVPLDPRDPQDLKKKKGILSKGKKLLKRLSPVK